MRRRLQIALAVGLWLSLAATAIAQSPPTEGPAHAKPERTTTMPAVEFRTAYAKWQIAQDATTSLLTDVAGKTNYARIDPPAPIAYVTAGGKEYPATAAKHNGRNMP